MQTILQDLRYTLRQIRNNPGFALVTILVLVLGIGVSTATFTVLNGVLLRKPAIPDIDRLVTVAEPHGEDEVFWSSSLPDARDWRAQSRSLEQLAYYSHDMARWERDSGTQRLNLIRSSGNFFATLAVQPMLGRVFSDEEEQAGAKVVVLNHRLWQESFAANPKILGQTLKMVGMFGIVGRKDLKPDQMPQGDLRFSSPEYPTTLGITIERGHFFDAAIDTPTSQPVAVVNHAFVARYLHGEDPTQKALSMGEKAPWSSVPIVGVIADVRQSSVKLPPGPEIHLSTTQLSPGARFYNVGSEFAQVAVRTRQKPDLIIPAIRKVVHEVAADVATGDFNTMSEVVEDNMGSETLAARLASLFSGATLLIAITGLYGLLSYSVTQRTQEIGIRMALGAQRTDVLAIVLRRAFLLLFLGVGVGLVLALSTSRILHSFLYGVRERDFVTMLAVCGVLCLCGAIAAYVPARRAASVDPLVALRTE